MSAGPWGRLRLSPFHILLPVAVFATVAAWPQAEAHQLADVGHWVVEDAPEDAERLLANFLAPHGFA